ncbi:MAG: PAS domain S-box protein [Methanoculleus sp.]
MTPTRISGPIHEAPPEYRILDSTDDCYLLIDEDYDVVWANLAFQQTFGTPEGDLKEIIYALGEDEDLVAWTFAVLDGSCEVSGIECRLSSTGGKEQRYLCSARKALPSDKGWLLQFREIRDMGDYGAIIEYTGAATILIEDDTTISAVNTEFERLSGYPRREIVDIKRLTDFIAYEDERQRLMGYHAVRQGDDPTAAPKNYSFSFMDRSGTIHTVEVTIGMIPRVNRSVMSLIDVTERRRAEQALQESEERLNLAFTAANAGLIDWDLNTGTIFCSPRCFTMLGYEPGATVPTIPSFLSIVHPDDCTRLEEALNDMVTGKRDRLSMEFRVRSASGKWIYVLERLQVVNRDADGAALRIAGTHTDITERKEAERELLIRDKAMESSLGAIALSNLEGKITYVNQASLTLHGWEREEIIGEPFSTIWANREEGEQIQEEALRSGAWLGEIEAQRSDGTTLPVQLAISVVTSESGEPLYLMGSGIDISRRKLAEQDLRIRDMAIASSLNAFTIADLDGRLTYINQAFLSMWGYASEVEVLGRSINEFWLDEEGARDAFRVLLDSGRYVAERVGRRRDETGFYVMYSGSLVTNDAGDPIYLMASIADITDLKRAEAEIQAHNRGSRS